MATIYRKTAKGISEIETRALRLAPRFRNLLILVDGRRTDDELVTMVAQAGRDALDALVAAGLIESIGEAAPKPSGERASPPPPARRAGAAPAAAPAPDTVRRDAARMLTDLVGPHGEEVAVRIERARDADDLARQLAIAARLIGNIRGRIAAADFVKRFDVGELPDSRLRG